MGETAVQGLPEKHRLFFSLVLSCLRACGILLPGAGIKPESPTLEGGFLTAGSPGKSQEGQYLFLGNASARSLGFYWRALTVRNPGGITIYHQPSALELPSLQWPLSADSSDPSVPSEGVCTHGHVNVEMFVTKPRHFKTSSENLNSMSTDSHS